MGANSTSGTPLGNELEGTSNSKTLEVVGGGDRTSLEGRLEACSKDRTFLEGSLKADSEGRPFLEVRLETGSRLVLGRMMRRDSSKCGSIWTAGSVALMDGLLWSTESVSMGSGTFWTARSFDADWSISKL